MIKKKEGEDMERLEAFEAMLAEVRRRYDGAVEKMAVLKGQGKERTATYRQLMGDKLRYQEMLSLYAVYGLVDNQ